MKAFTWILVSLAGVLSGLADGVRTAGTMVVNISADSLSGNDGDAIAQWTNSGTLGGSFSALSGNTGATFTNNLLGKKAVVFNGTVQSVLTNGAAPSSLTGTSPCSVETWVWVPTVPTNKSVYVSWTLNGSSASFDDTRWMLRYDTGSVSLDHYPDILNFGYGTPAAGAWHHIAVVRIANGQEKAYVDGNYSGMLVRSLSLETGRPVALGGVLNYSSLLYTNFFAGAIARMRVHSGTLSEQDVRNNFLAEALDFNATNNSVWASGTGNWNDAANWTNGTVAGSGRLVRILSGAVSLTNNVTPNALTILDMVSGSLTFATNTAQLATKTPFILGRGTGNSASLMFGSGAISILSSAGPAVIDFGMGDAASALTVGGSSSSATLSTSQLRLFAGNGSADIQVKSNGVLELDTLMAESPSNISVRVSGGTLRNRAGLTLGYLFNVPQVKIGDVGLVLDAASNSTMAVSAALTHDPAGSAIDGGLRKTSVGTLVLSGTNTYNGPTSVEAGVLALSSRLLDGLVYRLDASSNALSTLTFDSTSNVVAWADAAGSGIVFTTNKTEKCPVYDATLFGGRGGLRFTRDSTICRLESSTTNRVQSIFAVVSPASGNGLGGLWGYSGNDYGIRFNTTSVQYAGNDNDFSGSGWMYANGVAGNGFTVGQSFLLTAISGAAQTWRTAIGDYWGNASFRRGFRGDIAEILVYDRRLDDLERQAIEAYLTAKWFGTGSTPTFGPTGLPSNTVLSVRSGAGVELGGTPVQVSGLSGAGSIGNRSATAAALTVGGLNATGAFAGAITGNVSLVKVGSGTITLAGVKTYTGATIVQAGTLRLAANTTGITGLVYRLDASQTNTFTTLADGTNVSVWADAAGSGYTFTATNNAMCPVYERTLFNGRGGLRFGLGARKRMLGSAVTNAQTVLAVNLIRDTSNDNGGFWGMDANDTGLRIGGTTWYFPGNGNDFHYVGAGGLVAVNGAVSNALVNVGQTHLITSVSGTQKTFLPAIGDYWGSPQWTGRYYRGDVGEILVYDRRLSELERQTVEAALMTKWFLPTASAVLPATAAVTVASGATLDLAGSAVSIASLTGAGVVTNGQLAVTGTVTPTGTLTLPDAPTLTGTLSMDVIGDGTGDRVNVAGALNLSGLTLALALPTGKPTVTTYTLISAPGGVTGTFANVASSKAWKLRYTATTVQVVYSVGTLIQVQ